ncbi:MAG TPA: TonB family protein [Gammaproteobacteria bacterium]|nr:TonB family protein [Gammaproteobacteria bacterium]
MAGHACSGRWSERRGWLVALFVAVTAHAGVYQQLTHGDSKVRQHDVAPMVTVSLVTTTAAPAPAEPAAQPVVPVVAPEPVVAAPEPKAQPRPVKPKQSASPRQAPARPVEQQADPAPSPQLPQAIASASPTAAGRPSTTESPLEPPRADAAYLRNPPPSYPKRLLRRGVEGEVLVRAQVQDDGRCSRVQLKESSGFRQFDEAALSAVRDWRFVPARQGEQTVVAWVDVPIAFRITRSP